MEKDYDLLIIGGGSAGLTAARFIRLKRIHHERLNMRLPLALKTCTPLLLCDSL